MFESLFARCEFGSRQEVIAELVKVYSDEVAYLNLMHAIVATFTVNFERRLNFALHGEQ